MKKFLTLALLFILAFSYLFYSFANNTDRTNDFVLSVGSEKISSSLFENELARTIYRINNEVNDNIDNAYIKLIATYVKDKFIDNILIDLLISDMGIKINEDYVLSEIKSFSHFHEKNGIFNKEKFHEFLRFNKMGELEYFEEVRKMLCRKILFGVVFPDNFQSQALEEIYMRYYNHVRNLNIIKIERPNFDIMPNEDELFKFYDNEKALFLTDEMRQISYVQITPDMTKDEQVSDDEIEQEFQKNYHHYREYLQKIDIINILFDNEIEAKKWLTFLQEDFSESIIAIEKVNIASITKLSNVQLANISPELKEQITQMQPGEVSNIIKSPFGFHIIKLLSINKSENAENLVKSEIKEKILIFKKEEKFKNLLNAIEDYKLQENDLQEIANKFTLTIRQTDFFDKNTDESNLPNIKNIIKIAFTLQKNKISDLLIHDNEDINNYFLIRVNEILPEKQKDFSTTKDLVESEWKQKEQAKKHFQNANDVFVALQDNKNLNDLNIKIIIKYNEEWTIKNEDELDPKLHEIALHLNKNRRVSTPIFIDGHYYIVHLQDIYVKKLTEQEQERQLAEIRSQITNNWNDALYDDLLNYARTKFKVKINDKYFNKFDNI